MNSQFSPGAHPEKEAGTPTTGGVIYFNKVTHPTRITDPHAVIQQGNVVSFEDYRERALDAIGAPTEKNAA